MKGFPNQVANLSKLATGMRALTDLVDAGEDARDDGVFGEALVRTGVAGTGHTPMDVDRYIQQQRTKRPSNQSFRTTARGLRELYRLLGFIDDSGGRVVVTDLGRQAAAHGGTPLNTGQIDFWRKVVGNMTHTGGDPTSSHPYQLLLRLVGRKPGITRAKSALALEARDDSPEELDRIVRLADLSEEEIRRSVRITQSTWDNAKKVLPALAEQLNDVVVTLVGRDKTYRLADAPGRADAGPASGPAIAEMVAAEVGGLGGASIAAEIGGASPATRAPRTSRRVTPRTIARAGTAETFDEEASTPAPTDPAAAAEAIRQRLDRLRRHNLIVQGLAARLGGHGAELHEDPFDILAIVAAQGILVEVKTLDGTAADERDRVRDALGQLLYYEPFAAAPLVEQATIVKIACFERPITDAHRAWLNRSGIGVIWTVGEARFAGDQLAASVLSRYLEELP